MQKFNGCRKSCLRSLRPCIRWIENLICRRSDFLRSTGACWIYSARKKYCLPSKLDGFSTIMIHNWGHLQEAETCLNTHFVEGDKQESHAIRKHESSSFPLFDIKRQKNLHSYRMAADAFDIIYTQSLSNAWKWILLVFVTRYWLWEQQKWKIRSR